MEKPYKSYVLIMDWVDVGHAINSAAHAGALLMKEWENTPEVEEWLRDSFRKVTCKVTPEEFERAKQFEDKIVITELAFDKAEVAMVFKPRRGYPKFFQFLKLYNTGLVQARRDK